jgi:hypothetical protein
MTNEKSVHETTSDEALVNEAHRLADNETASMIGARQMEMTRRLIVALRAFSKSSDRWAKILAALNVALILLTLILAYLAWALLNRTHG